MTSHHMLNLQDEPEVEGFIMSLIKKRTDPFVIEQEVSRHDHVPRHSLAAESNPMSSAVCGSTTYSWSPCSEPTQSGRCP